LGQQPRHGNVPSKSSFWENEVNLSPLLSASVLAILLTASAQAQPSQSPVIARLHNDLRLNPSQEQGWTVFQQAYDIDPQEMAKRQDAASKMQAMTGPQRVDFAIGLAKADLAGLERRADALKKFYATLTPDQQHVFDQDTLPSGRGR
jgi:hypothetical protein